jgi:hypothetical protein
VGSCIIPQLNPGEFLQMRFYVHLGSRYPNGPVTAVAGSSSGITASVEIPPFRIIGPAGPTKHSNL